jgi:hypothetical protein
VNEDIVRQRAVPVLLAGLDMDPVSRANLRPFSSPQRTTTPRPGQHDDCLLAGVGVPVGVGARFVQEAVAGEA